MQRLSYTILPSQTYIMAVESLLNQGKSSQFTVFTIFSHFEWQTRKMEIYPTFLSLPLLTKSIALMFHTLYDKLGIFIPYAFYFPEEFI